MNNSIRCMVCQHPLQGWNRQFYCCDKNQRYCLICQGKNCVRCGKAPTKQFVAPRCNHCLRTSSSGGNDLLYQPNCEKYYCAKCMVSRLPAKHQPGIICSLPCGHGMQIEKIKDFLKGNYCLICGKPYEPSTDYDLLNGQKVCFACFKWQKPKIQQWIMSCVSCGETARKVEDVGSFNEGFVICKKCVTQSQIQQTFINKEQEQKKIQQKRLNQNLKNKKLNQTLIQQQLRKNQQLKNQTQPEYKVNIIQPNYQTNLQQTQPQQPPGTYPPKQQQANKPVRNITPNKKSNQSPNIFKTFSQSPKGNSSTKQVQSVIQIQPISNQQQSTPKQIPVSSSNPMKDSNGSQKTTNKSNNNDSNLKKTILQSFPSQKQQQASDLPRSRMKKHLSMQTFIQKMKIKIQKQKVNLVECNECEYQIPQSESFQIQNAQHVLKNYCRLCYTFLTNTQLLGFNINGQNTKLDLSRNTYRRGVSNEKHKMPTNSLISSPEQLLNTGMQQMKLSANNFDNHQKMSATVKVSDNKNIYREQCGSCKKTGMSLIRTHDRGALCFQCYYQKRQVRV